METEFSRVDFYLGLAGTLLVTRVLDFFIIEYVINKLKRFKNGKTKRAR